MASRARAGWGVVAALCIGCGAPPKPAPKPAAVAAQRPAGATAGAWSIASDAEFITRLEISPTHIWGLTANGLVAWHRQTGAFLDLTGSSTPASGALAFTASVDGTPYVGRADGLAFRERDRRWQKVDVGPLRGGVVALAPRPQGGVWVGTARALGWYDRGTLHVVYEGARVRALTTATDGAVYAATDGRGVLAVRGDAITEYTTAQGLCGNQVRAVEAGTDGRVAALCAEPQALTRFSLFADGQWFTYQTFEVGGTVEAAVPVPGGVALRTQTGAWRLEAAPAPTPGAPAPTGPRVQALSMAGVAAPTLPGVEPPAGTGAAPTATAPTAGAQATGAPAAAAPAADAPAAGATPTGGAAPAAGATPTAGAAPAAGATPAAGAAPAASAPSPGAAPAAGGPPAAEAQRPPPVPMPPPVAGAGPPPLETEPLPVKRAPVTVAGDPGQAPRFAAHPAVEPGLPAGVPVTARAQAADGARYFAVAHQGVYSILGDKVRRYASLSLVPRRENAALLLDAEGRPVLVGDAAAAHRWTGDRWAPWRVTGMPDHRLVNLGVDPDGRLVALAEHRPEAPTPPPAATDAEGAPPPAAPPRPSLVLLRAEGSTFHQLGRFAAPPELEGPAQAGPLLIDGRGEVLVPLFWQESNGQLRGAGLARFADGGTRLEVWKGRLDFDEEAHSPVPLMPDAWVNDVARNSAGVTYVATNAGLVQVAGGKAKVYDENDFIDSEVITAVAVADGGRVWAGTLEGLGYLEADKWHAVDAEGLDARIGAVAVDPKGTVWVAAETGLWRSADGKRWQSVPLGAGVPAAGVRDLVFAQDGAIWLLTTQGVVRFTPAG